MFNILQSSRSELKALAKNLKLVILEKNFILQEKDEEVKKVFLVAKGVVKEKVRKFFLNLIFT
jgi:signal-transduction protein with cAMP-binding, CBS, and nucleotidyltransferase domain